MKNSIYFFTLRVEEFSNNRYMQEFEEKTPRPINLVSNAEISNFTQGQENQGIMRRRTISTPHK